MDHQFNENLTIIWITAELGDFRSIRKIAEFLKIRQDVAFCYKMSINVKNSSYLLQKPN